jgi:hypothetical protein
LVAFRSMSSWRGARQLHWLRLRQPVPSRSSCPPATPLLRKAGYKVQLLEFNRRLSSELCKRRCFSFRRNLLQRPKSKSKNGFRTFDSRTEKVSFRPPSHRGGLCFWLDCCTRRLLRRGRDLSGVLSRGRALGNRNAVLLRCMRNCASPSRKALTRAQPATAFAQAGLLAVAHPMA